jgi:hypothetical protein
MSRLTIAKAERFNQKFINCCSEPRFDTLFMNSGNMGVIGAKLKDIFLCAFENANNGQSGTDKINKQELYTILFTMGFPLGLIAKTLLNANLAPVRNAVIMYKAPVYGILDARFTDVCTSIDRLSTRQGIDVRRFATNVVDFCNYAGGSALAEKLLYSKDIEVFLTNYYPSINWALDGIKRKPFAGIGSVSVAMLQHAAMVSAPSRRGQVRRTGLTTSRVSAGSAQQTVQAVQSSTPTNPVIVQTTSLSTPAADAVQGAAATTTTRQARQLVRDVSIDTTTFGIEIEGSFITDGLDSVKKPSGSTFVDYMKKLVVEMDLPAKEYNKNMTVKREGTLSMKREGETTPNGKVCWSYKGDGSVYGGNETREIVSPILKGENGIKQLKAICSAMRRSGFYSNATAGVHVHLGAEGLTLEVFKNICYNYTMFEPLVDMIFPTDRRWSNAYFAESFSTKQDWERKIDSATDFSGLTNYSGIMGDRRYFKVNLQAFHSLGTIEFRQCIGTNDDRLITWFLYYCFYIIEVSKRKRLTNFNLKNLQDILPTWAYTYFIDRVRSVSGYDIKYGYDVGSRGSTGDRRNTNTRGGDPMISPLNTSRGTQKNRRGGQNRYGDNDIFD